MSIKDEKGFTLIEIITAVGISMVLIGGIYMSVNSTQRHSSSIERRVSAQSDVKPALDLMAMEISMASFNPTNSTTMWLTVNYSTCSSVASANQDNLGIQLASDTDILLEMDTTGRFDPTDGSRIGNGQLDDASEVISYSYNAANQEIRRITYSPVGGVCADSQPFLGSNVAGQKTVRVINQTLGIPVFRYFDGQGIEIAVSGTTLGGRIPEIRRIEIVLAIETEDINVNTGQRSRLIYSTSVVPKNHAIQ